MRCLNCHQDGIAQTVQVCPQCSTHLPTLLRDILPNGKRIRSDGNYELNYALGRGGFGVTYRAFNHGLDEAVAIKEYFPQAWVMRNSETQMFTIPPDKQESYQRGLKRFIKEGRILRKFSHPNIVRVEDIFQERDTAYLVMELVSGQSLKQYVKSKGGKLAEEEVEKIIGQVVEALAVVHEANFYHLDLKPDNILLTADGQVKLIDFGAAKQELSGSRTHHSTMSFTEIYAPPELLAQEEVGRESDIFELGMLVHELLVGELPPPVMQRFVSGDKWQPEGIEEPWQMLVQKALLLEKNNRPSDIKQWWQQVKPALTPTTDSQDMQLSVPKDFQKISSKTLQVTAASRAEKQPKLPKLFIELPKSFIEDLGGGVKLEMVLVLAGNFMIGTSDQEVKRFRMQYQRGAFKEKYKEGYKKYIDEFLEYQCPQHTVNIIEPFYIGKYPVTQSQWQAVMRNNPSYHKNVSSRHHPVDSVSWMDCQQFIQKLNETTKKNGYRLPSEAEWEYCCRAGTQTTFYFGNQITQNQANYNKNHNNKTTIVQSFIPNGFGLYNMHGNVWEWCEDDWEENYNIPRQQKPYIKSENNNFKVRRGGSWHSLPIYLCSASRNYKSKFNRQKTFGFRLVYSP